MNCNCEYGRCNQSFGCPVRAHPADGYIVPTGKPMPKECLKAGSCLSETEQCECETLDKSIVSTKEVGVWSAILFCLVVVLLLWLIGQTPILSMQFF